MITSHTIRSFATAAAISLALLLCASCADQSQTVATVPQPKEWTGPTPLEHSLPPIRPAEAPAVPATQSSEEFTLTPTTHPSEMALRTDLQPTEQQFAARRKLLNEPSTQSTDERVQPGPDNTGVADQKNLKISKKITAVDNQVIENMFITGGIVANDTHNVVIRNCLIDGSSTARYGLQCQHASNLLIEHCEIYNATSACVYGDGFTARWNNVHHSGGDGLKPGTDCVVESNWVHDLGYKSPSAHADGVQSWGGNNVKIIGNYFDMDTSVPDTRSNSSCFITGQKGKQPAANILIEGNWCRGGNFTVHCSSDGGDPTTIHVINNRFMKGSSRYGCGLLEKGVVWEGNVFDETDAAAGPGDK